MVQVLVGNGAQEAKNDAEGTLATAGSPQMHAVPVVCLQGDGEGEIETLTPVPFIITLLGDKWPTVSEQR
jgi:hypothetical protein